MTEAIIVNYDPFAMESAVYIARDGQQNQMKVCSDLEGLAGTLIGIAYGNDIYDIKIHAPFATTGEIQRLVTNLEQNMYSENKIMVEGI